MNLLHLYYFQSLAETMHYAKSAELLHTSTSNLSYAISMLEQKLGFTLFKKCGRNIKITPSGEIFLGYVSRAISELEEGKAAAQSATLRTNGNRVRVAAFRLHAANDLIQSYNNQAAAPVEIQMHHQKTGTIIEQLKYGTLDIGFCTYIISDPELCFYPVLVQHLVALVPKDHLLSSSSGVTLPELSRYPLIIPHGSDGMYSRIMGMFRKLGISPHISCQANSLNAAANLSSLGKGIAISVNFPVLTYFNLEIIPVIDAPEVFYIYFAHASNLRDSDVLADMVQYFKRYSKENIM